MVSESNASIPDRGRLTKSSSGKGKIGENSWLETSTQTSYQRSWKNSRWEKRNIGDNPYLRTGALTDSKRFCDFWEREYPGKLQAS